MTTDITTNPLYRVNGVGRSYSGVEALAPVQLSIGGGEAVAVVGPSGAGKTTLLHLLAGVIQPDRGSIGLDGHTLSNLRPGRELSALVGVIHQQFDLVPHLSVVHNVLAGRLGRWGIFQSVRSLLSPRELDVAQRALERVGIAELMYARTSRLSGGEQQRVAIARLLVQDPQVIVADEPVASLDPARARDLLGLLSAVTKESGKTLIASMHQVEMAREYFSRVIGLRDGQLRFDLPVGQVTDGVLDDLYDLQGPVGDGAEQA
jgi:phosphonate transport system ATP-binding protein